MKLLSHRIPPWLVVSLCFLCFALVMQAGHEIRLQPDSEGYLSFAKDIKSGALFTESQASWYSTIRTPGYPLLLAAAQAVFGENQLAVVLLHTCLGLLALLCFVFRFRSSVTAPVAAALCLLAFYLWTEYYNTVLTEWPSLCVILLIFSVIPQRALEFTRARFLTLALLISAAVLIRPALLVMLLACALLLLFIPREERKPYVVCVLVGLSPLFFWCLFNLYRLNHFGLAAFTGHNLFGVASVIGHADFEPDTDPLLRRFASYVNENKRPPPKMEEESVRQLAARYYNLPYNYNIYQVALHFAPDEALERALQDDLMERYAKRVLFNNPLRYFSFVFQGLKTFLRDAWLLLIASVVTVLLIRNKNPLGIVLSFALLLHVSHIVLCSAVQVVISRYYLLTLIPLGLVITLCLVAAIKPSYERYERGL